MLHIDKFGIRVFVYQPEDEPKKKFGRDIEFGQGLSVVAGDNTTGKTTPDFVTFACHSIANIENQ